MACASPVNGSGAQGWLLSSANQKASERLLATGHGHHRQRATSHAAPPRLHLQHGPIDLLIAADGEPDEVLAAYQQARLCFDTVLDTLAAQLPQLRRVLRHDSVPSDFQGDVARRMYAAAQPHVSRQVTPMIAVAGAVADHVLEHMLADRLLDRVQVNNGGDIALYLAPGKTSRIGICPSPLSPRYGDVVTLKATPQVGGIATSGWQGRSHSLGIADAVTVLASNAAMADAAATLIANAVNLPDSPKVKRAAACSLSPDSDLGQRSVTVDVQALSATEKAVALQAGAQCAARLLSEGLLKAACLHLQGQSRVVGALFDHHQSELTSTPT